MLLNSTSDSTAQKLYAGGHHENGHDGISKNRVPVPLRLAALDARVRRDRPDHERALCGHLRQGPDREGRARIRRRGAHGYRQFSPDFLATVSIL